MDAFSKIPARPVLSADAFGYEDSRCLTLLDAGQVKLTLNARTALAHGLLHAKIGYGDSVLVPAYHCPAMVSPLAWLGIEPVFYPILPNTTVDVEALLNFIQPNTRALIAVHYFGFIQDMRPLRQFCDTQGLVLIEDCAHAFFGSIDGKPLGTQGDYAIASIMKFLPIDEGGCLVSSKRSLDSIKLKPGGIFFQLKSALNTIEIACDYSRLSSLGFFLELKKRLWSWVKRLRPVNNTPDSAIASSENMAAEYVFDSSKLETHMSWSSTAIMRGVSLSQACARRRENYLRMLVALNNIRGGKPLFRDLQDSVYPQVFPMLIDHPEKIFPELKQRGVPIIRFGEFRWKGVDGLVCPVSDDLSRRVFQFPCHQSLTAQEMDWMIDAIRTVLSDS